jgi:hypothetical protein
MSRYDRWSHDGAPSAEENRRIQAGIDDCMRSVISDRRKDPTSLPPSPTVTVVGAVEVKEPFEPRGTGWAEPRSIESPPGQSAIERLVNAALPHGPKSKAG